MNSVPLKNKENAPSRPVYRDFSKRDEIGKIGSIDGPEFPVEAKEDGSALDTSAGRTWRILERGGEASRGTGIDETKTGIANSRKIRSECLSKAEGEGNRPTRRLWVPS